VRVEFSEKSWPMVMALRSRVSGNGSVECLNKKSKGSDLREDSYFIRTKLPDRAGAIISV